MFVDVVAISSGIYHTSTPSDKGWEEERSEIWAKFGSLIDRPIRIQLPATRSHCMETIVGRFASPVPIAKNNEEWTTIIYNQCGFWGSRVVLANVLQGQQSAARSEPCSHVNSTFIHGKSLSRMPSVWMRTQTQPCAQ